MLMDGWKWRNGVAGLYRDADDGGAGGGAGTGGGDGDGEGGGDGGQQQDGQTFTQEELDRIVKQRLERERARYADYEELKKAKEELKKLQDADLSEQEKLKKKVQELEDAQAEAERQAKTMELEVNEKLVRAEVRMAAATMQFVSPDDAYSLADLADVKVEEDGSVKGVDKALEKLAKDKPYLLKAEDGQSGAGTPPRGRGSTTTRSTPPGGTEEKRPLIRF
jgi:Spy/CpxP family protein refolding chaperone